MRLEPSWLKASAESLSRVWNNEEDKVYNESLKK
jgi:hypothetical protein